MNEPKKSQERERERQGLGGWSVGGESGREESDRRESDRRGVEVNVTGA